MTVRVSILTLIAAVALVPNALAQPADYSGTWAMQASALLPGENVPCMYEGTVTLMQNGDQLSGPVMLSLVSGPAACPGELMAQLTATVNGAQIEMGMLDGGAMLGTAFFSGGPGDGMDDLVGRFGVETGPYAGTNGAWAAQRLISVLEIPTLTTVGLVALVALLLAAATVILRRRRA